RVGVVAVDVALLLYAPQWNFDYAVLVFADYRFFGDDVGDFLTDRFADFLTMAQPVARRTVRALRVGRSIFPEDRFAGGHATVLYQDYMTDPASKRTSEDRPLGKRAKVRGICSFPVCSFPGFPAQSFQRLLAAYFSTTSTHDSQ